MVYVHIPFCRSFCTYCDFYSEIAGDGRCFARFADRLCAEIRSRREEVTDTVPTLYFGGGTPSVLPLCVFRRIFEALSDAGCKAPWAECTVEVNPEDIVEKGASYVEGLLSLGVNRISMGVQSFDDGVLRWMNRRHDGRRAREAFHMLRAAGMENISIDLIFGFPLLSEPLWEETLDAALALHPEHLSAYQLSLEPGSALQQLSDAGRFEEAGEDLCRRQYDRLCRRMDEAGYRHYEISNFALPGREALHNSAYWRRVPYVGFGPGAHSFDGTVRRWNTDNLADYRAESEHLTAEQVLMERIMLSLRTDRGIEAADLHNNCREETVVRLLSEGALREEDGFIRIPPGQWFVSDGIIRTLVETL